MAVADHHTRLHDVLERASEVSPEHPTVITSSIENAKKIEIDAVLWDEEMVVYASSEHVENAGVHFRDATPRWSYRRCARTSKLGLAAKSVKCLRIRSWLEY